MKNIFSSFSHLCSAQMCFIYYICGVVIINDTNIHNKYINFIVYAAVADSYMLQWKECVNNVSVWIVFTRTKRRMKHSPSFSSLSIRTLYTRSVCCAQHVDHWRMVCSTCILFMCENARPHIGRFQCTGTHKHHMLPAATLGSVFSWWIVTAT